MNTENTSRNQKPGLQMPRSPLKDFTNKVLNVEVSFKNIESKLRISKSFSYSKPAK